MNRRLFALGLLALSGAGGGLALAQQAGGKISMTIEDVSLEDLKRGLANGSIVLVDVREPNEWDAGRIPGALFNPLSAFDGQAAAGTSRCSCRACD